MFEAMYIALAILNNLLLTGIFILRKYEKMDITHKFGYGYLALCAPASYLLIACFREAPVVQYAIFLSLFLCYLVMEFLYDFVLRLDFRHNRKLLIPYLLFYYAANYGLFAMTWKISQMWGAIVLVLLLLQLAANFWSHGNGRDHGQKGQA